MSRYKITIQYNGQYFKGWQLQKQVKTIQGELEIALAILNQGKTIRVIGSGRTDTGVHATGQVAHFDFKTDLSEKKLKAALNGNLTGDIHILECYKIASDFHARYSARKRNYIYRCRTDDYILDRFFSLITGEIDVDILNCAAKMVLGDHDFKSLSRINSELKHYRCIVYESVWKTEGSIVNYRISANRFLHHMVRFLVGTMLEISKGRISLEEFEDLLLNPRIMAKVFKAPAHGLVLEKVEYDKYL